MLGNFIVFFTLCNKELGGCWWCHVCFVTQTHQTSLQIGNFLQTGLVSLISSAPSPDLMAYVSTVQPPKQVMKVLWPTRRSLFLSTFVLTSAGNWNRKERKMLSYVEYSVWVFLIWKFGFIVSFSKFRLPSQFSRLLITFRLIRGMFSYWCHKANISCCFIIGSSKQLFFVCAVQWKNTAQSWRFAVQLRLPSSSIMEKPQHYYCKKRKKKTLIFRVY